MIRALIVLNGPNGNIEFEVGKKAGSHPNHAKVENISHYDEGYNISFDDGEQWIIRCQNIIVKCYPFE